jgi:hypothetical protein
MLVSSGTGRDGRGAEADDPAQPLWTTDPRVTSAAPSTSSETDRPVPAINSSPANRMADVMVAATT